jgi:hypothetical protein
MTNTQDETMRGTGRSTACVLEAIAAALRNPGKDIEFVDHLGPLTADGARMFTDATEYTAAQIGLAYVKVWNRDRHVFVRSCLVEKNGRWVPEIGFTRKGA